MALVPVPIRDRRSMGKCEGFENVTQDSVNVERQNAGKARGPYAIVSNQGIGGGV